MIVIGNRYEFTEYEQERLNNQGIIFSHTAETESDLLIEVIEAKLAEGDGRSGILLNLENPAEHDLIQYLTKLELKGIRFYTLEDFMEKELHKMYIAYDSRNLSYLNQTKPFSFFQYLVKRLIDLLGVVVIGLLALPIVFYTYFRIKNCSPGPVFFTQERMGVKGEVFTLYKFRSMHVDSEFNPYTQKNDPRIFPFGDFIRKIRIDELPQLLNVLKGDMHLVGPRAEWDILVEEYENEIPYYRERHLVRPGITGWAQVMYPYGANTEDARQKLMYDLYYIKNWSVWLEIKTAFLTVMVVLRKRGL